MPTLAARPSTADVQALAAAHLGLVHTIAHQARRRLPRSFEVEDLTGVGAVGLLHAARRFDPRLGIPFVAFARKRIEGEILNYINRADARQRQYRRDQRASSVPPVPVIEVQLEVSDQPFHVPAPGESPETATARAREGALVRDVVEALPARLRRVILDYYFSGRSYRAIGAKLRTRRSARGHQAGQRPRRLSTARVHLLHVEAIEQLRRVLMQRGVTAESLCK